MMRSGISLALITMATLLALAAFGLFIFGAYQFLATVIDPAVAAFLTGSMTFILALVILWIGIRLSR